jgi:DNA-directed RNA polymerase specialized sigma24 family protein
MAETNEELVLQKLETLVRLQAFALTSRFDSQKEKILFLNKVGMKPKEIAELIDSTSNAVSVAIFQAKQPRPSKRQKKASNAGPANSTNLEAEAADEGE